MEQVLYGVEGATDVPVAEALIRLVGRVPRQVLVARGKSRLDQRLLRWNKPSNNLPFLILRDWDLNDTADCVPGHAQALLGTGSPAPRLSLRIPVRATEAWLMADALSFRSYFATSTVPTDPDDARDPKSALVDACRGSRSSSVRRDMVPREGSGRRVGDLYEGRIIEFGRDHWNPERAQARSPSLARTLARLADLVERGIW